MANFLSRWKDGLSRSSKAAFGQIASLLGTSEITNETWDDLEALLVQADLGIETATSVLDSLKRITRTEGLVPSDELFSALRQELRQAANDLPKLLPASTRAHSKMIVWLRQTEPLKEHIAQCSVEMLPRMHQNHVGSSPLESSEYRGRLYKIRPRTHDKSKFHKLTAFS